MTTIRKTYKAEFKVKVVKEILREEKSLSQIASESRDSEYDLPKMVRITLYD